MVGHVQIALVGLLIAVVVAVVVLVRRRCVGLAEVHASEPAVGLQGLPHHEQRVDGIVCVVAAHRSFVVFQVWVRIYRCVWVDWRSVRVYCVWVTPLILLAGVLAPLIGIGDDIRRNVGVDWLVPAASLLRAPAVVLIPVGIDLRLIILLRSPLSVLRLRVAPLLVLLRLIAAPLLVRLRLIAAPLIILLISAPLVAWLLLLISPRVWLGISLAELIVVGLGAASTDPEQNLACSLPLIVQLHNL